MRKQKNSSYPINAVVLNIVNLCPELQEAQTLISHRASIDILQNLMRSHTKSIFVFIDIQKRRILMFPLIYSPEVFFFSQYVQNPEHIHD